MSKAEDLAEKAYPEGDIYIFGDASIACRVAYVKGYHQAEEDLIDKTLSFLKDRLYKDGYVGIIDLCDDYIKAMKNG